MATNTNGKDGLQEDIDLLNHGYVSEMPRQFSVFSLVSLSFLLTCTWSGTGSSIGISLMEFSSVGTTWSLPIAGLMTAILSLGIAELASAFPVAGAQYYWSFAISNEKYAAFAAYMNGWLSVFGWWLASAAVCNFIASMILSLVLLWYPDFQAQHWHQWLIYVGIIWLAVAINVFGAKILPHLNSYLFVTAITSLVITTITLFVTSRHNHASAEWVFTDSTNLSGYESNGFAFILSISNAVYSFLGTDCGAHMIEEVHEPRKNIPKVIMYPILIGLATAWPFACACMTAITDVDAVLNTTTGLPLLEIYYQGTQSRVAATVLLALFALCFFGCTLGNATTCSRTIWAISRDGAFPYSSLWATVDKRFGMPLNAICLSGTMISLYGIIFLGSSTAFSSMISAAIVFLQTSCIVPQFILLVRGREKCLPEEVGFLLGRWGYLVNGVSVVWVFFLDVIYCFPTAVPVTAGSMNYVSVVIVALVGFVLVLWFVSKRGEFTGPNIGVHVNVA